MKRALRLGRFFRPQAGYFFVGLIFLFLSTGATLAFPYLLGDLVDLQTIGQINNLAIVLLVIFFANAIFSFFRIYLFEIVTQKSLARLRKETYQNLISLPMQFFASRRVGELTSRISSDIALLQSTFTTTAAEFIRQVVTIIGGVVMLSTISGKLTLFMLSVVPVFALTAFVFGKFIQRLSKQTQDKIADSTTIVEETLQGIQNVKAFANEKYEYKRYGNVVNDIVIIALKASRFRGAFVSFIIFGLFGSIVGVIWYGLILQSEGAISQGDLFSFILYTVFVGASFGGIADIYSQIVKAVGATENLLDIIDETPEEVAFQASSPLHLNGSLTYENVSFSYPSRRDIPVLKNVTFKLEEGKQLAIVGPSGAGKSTIVSLIYRFYHPTHGKICIDGKAISTYELTALRNEMALVPQEVLLFGGTILENIKYGNPLATQQEVKEAAQLANAAEFIEQFPEQYETLVGDRGIQLSGGQRQRIAIARAVLKNPKILILDEATSSLDSESEQLVQQALERLMENRTTIVIAHRLSTIRKADQILVLENGEVKELGTHDELTSQDEGIFKRLLALQNG